MLSSYVHITAAAAANVDADTDATGLYREEKKTFIRGKFYSILSYSVVDLVSIPAARLLSDMVLDDKQREETFNDCAIRR